MKPRHRYKPYVRRANGKERTESFRIALRLAFYRELGKPFWVMVQRGWPNLAIECGPTAAEVRASPLMAKLFGFKIWANRLKQRALGQCPEPLEKQARRELVKYYKLKRATTAEGRVTTRRWQDYQVNIPEGQSGLWSVHHFDVPKEFEERFLLVRVHEYTNSEWGMLDELVDEPEPIRHVVAGKYTRLEVMHGDYQRTCVMSDIQPEIEEHYPLFDAAHGRVLIHGLGLGMCAMACARLTHVTKVHVIEKSTDVLALVGKHLEHPKLTIEHADARAWEPRQSWDTVWSDIWTYIDPGNLPEMRRLEKMYRGKCGWHGFWLRDACERRARKLKALSIVSSLSERFRVRSSSMRPLCRMVYALEKERRT